MKAFLLARRAAATMPASPAHRILLDPGIGFGKTVEHNLELLRDIATSSARPAGGYRHQPQGFIGRITGETTRKDRLFGTAATVAWSIANGAAIVGSTMSGRWLRSYG